MTSSEFVWSEICDLANQLRPGAHITCSLLGRVMPVRCDSGYVGEIPSWLQNKALRHGLQVIGADYTSDMYTFEVLPRKER